jgi:aryl-alcohol dehydrogenase-like predicted oxidoreductase
LADQLPTAVLGRTGLRVTQLGYGTGSNRGDGPDMEQWGILLNSVLDRGINFIDTANCYGVGRGIPSEVMIGRHISQRRPEYHLATKCGCAPKGPDIWTRQNAFRGLHESLERMETDYVDLMQYHNPTVAECEQGDLVAVLQDMQRQGKVRWLGISTTLPDLETFIQWNVFDAFQVPYSALERDHEDWITRAARAGAGVIVRGGVAQGQPGIGAGHADRWERFEQAGLDDLRQNGESRTTLILRFTMTHPHAATNIVGTMNLDHLDENLQGIQRGPLPPDVYAEAKHRLDQVGVTPAT